MEKKLMDQLGRDLPSISNYDRSDIMRVICAQPIQRSLQELSASLIVSGVEIGVLLSAMLRCEWLSVQDLIERMESTNVHAGVAAFSSCIEHFNDLQSAIILAFDHKWHAALDEEVRSRVLAQGKALWSEQGVVQLHNYFHEMPITAKVKYLHFAEDELEVEISPETGRVFAASDDMREVITSSPDEQHFIRFAALGCSHNTLRLVVRSVEKSRRELRKNLRIAPDAQLEIQINRHGQPVIALMHDISTAGMGLEVVGRTDIQPGEMLGCRWQLEDSKIWLEAHACWVMNADKRSRIGVRFSSLGPFGDMIRKFMVAQQQVLISRIKQLSEPPWMRDRK
ncbi:MAG: hypothetical protein AUJ57_08330 [Zetaproteobacteria bacterium CG1_02_53_45]|nr:MAG: hypothetical protein AUJ57_08330 [Zetaproteobacteria bacterium CG1_02_53_45]